MALNDDVWNMEPSWSRSTPASRYGGMQGLDGNFFSKALNVASFGVLGSSGKKSYTVSPQTGQKLNTDLPAKQIALRKAQGAISTLLLKINSAGQQYQTILAGSPQEGALNAAAGAVAELEGIQASIEEALPAVSKTYGSFTASTDAWNQADTVEQAAKQALDNFKNVAGELQSAAGQVQSAARASQAQQLSDVSAVNGALTKATGFAAVGNYGGALAEIQKQNVVDAAARLGRSGDLDSAAAAIGYQQKQQQDAQDRINKAKDDERVALQQGKADCDARSGRWTGTSCDMSAVEARIRADAAASSASSADAQRAAASAKVDAAIQQANARAASNDFRGALLILSGATAFANQADRALDVQVAMADVQEQQDRANQEKARGQIQARVQAAIRQANTYAAGGSFDIALNVLNSVLSDASQVNLLDDVSNAQLTIQNMKRDAQASKDAGLAPGQALQQNRQAAEQCFDRGGEWDPTSLYCNMRPVREREQAERDRQAAERAEQAKLDRLMALQPLASGNAALQAQILAAILGQSGVTVDPSALTPQAPTMATSVPGGDGGWSPPGQQAPTTFSSSPMFAPSGGYVDFGGGGRESF